MATPRGLVKVFSDMFSSQSGDYDPARVVGYSFVALAGLIFLGLYAYIVIRTGDLHTGDFTQGTSIVGALLLGAAGGVLLKAKTENPVNYQQPDPSAPSDQPPTTKE